MDDLPDFSDRKAVEAWLRDQPRPFVILFAARAAARVLPVLALAKPMPGKDRLADIFLPCARAISVSSAVYVFADDTEMARAAADAADAAANAANAAANAANADAAANAEHGPDRLAVSPLWLSAQPERFAELWRDLRRDLLDAGEGWEVWTDWYDGQLSGGPVDWDLERSIALIPNHI